MKRDSNFKLSKSAKRVLSTIDNKAERTAWKEAFISAEMNTADRMMMNYDIGSNGKPPRKVLEKQNANG